MKQRKPTKGIDDRNAARPAGKTAARICSALKPNDLSALPALGLASGAGGSGSTSVSVPVGRPHLGQKPAPGGRAAPQVQNSSMTAPCEPQAGEPLGRRRDFVILRKRRFHCTVGKIRCYTKNRELV